MDFIVCLLSSKINPQQLAYLANLTKIIPIMPLLLGSFYVLLHATRHVMASLSKSIGTTSEAKLS